MKAQRFAAALVVLNLILLILLLSPQRFGLAQTATGTVAPVLRARSPCCSG